MSLVLAIEPDAAQAAVLRDIARSLSIDRFEVVATNDEALRFLLRDIPDLILVTALLGPGDEEALCVHLRTLAGASHLQTLAIPRFRTSAPAESSSRFRFRRRQESATGCDPDVFCEQVRAYLAWAADVRRQEAEAALDAAGFAQALAAEAVEPAVTPAAHVASAVLQEEEEEWLVIPLEGESSDGFEVSVGELGQDGGRAEPVVDSTAEMTRRHAEELARLQAEAETLRLAAVEEARQTVELEAREAMERTRQQAEARTREAVERARIDAEAEAREAMERTRFQAEAQAREAVERARLDAETEAREAVERARLEADAEARTMLAQELSAVRLEAEAHAREAIERARVEADAQAREAMERSRLHAEAETREAVERARVDAEAEAREAVERARLDAEAQARTALAQELSAVRQHAERAFADALKRVREEAAETLAAEVGRAREEAAALQQTELTRVENEAETRLRVLLDEARAAAEQARKTDLADAKWRAEEVREAAAREARAAAEVAAASTLNAELARVRSDAEQRVAEEVARVRMEAEQQRAVELNVLRAQIAEVKAAAAKRAATVIVAPAPAVIREPQSMVQAGEPKWTVPTRLVAAQKKASVPVKKEPPRAAPPSQGSGSYYSLWESDRSPARPPNIPRGRPAPPSVFHRWALPIAATLVFVTSGGVAINVASFDPISWVKRSPAVPAAEQADVPISSIPAKPARATRSARVRAARAGAAPRPAVPPAAPPISPFGQIHVIAPSGTMISVEGAQIGQAPVSMSLPAGVHEVVGTHPELGQIRQRIDVKGDERITVGLESNPKTQIPDPKSHDQAPTTNDRPPATNDQQPTTTPPSR